MRAQHGDIASAIQTAWESFATQSTELRSLENIFARDGASQHAGDNIGIGVIGPHRGRFGVVTECVINWLQARSENLAVHEFDGARFDDDMFALMRDERNLRIIVGLPITAGSVGRFSIAHKQLSDDAMNEVNYRSAGARGGIRMISLLPKYFAGGVIERRILKDVSSDVHTPETIQTYGSFNGDKDSEGSTIGNARDPRFFEYYFGNLPAALTRALLSEKAAIVRNGSVSEDDRGASGKRVEIAAGGVYIEATGDVDASGAQVGGDHNTQNQQDFRYFANKFSEAIQSSQEAVDAMLANETTMTESDQKALALSIDESLETLDSDQKQQLALKAKGMASRIAEGTVGSVIASVLYFHGKQNGLIP